MKGFCIDLEAEQVCNLQRGNLQQHLLWVGVSSVLGLDL